jgi:hypothetical protein
MPSVVPGRQAPHDPRDEAIMRDTGTLPGLPTTSARTRQGTWALYCDGDEVLVVYPGGRLAGPPAEVAAELDRLATRRGYGELDRQAARTIRSFLTGDGARWDGSRGRLLGRRVRTWSSPAVAYWISGPYNDPDRQDCLLRKTTSSGSAWNRTVSLACSSRSLRRSSVHPQTITRSFSSRDGLVDTATSQSARLPR